MIKKLDLTHAFLVLSAIFIVISFVSRHDYATQLWIGIVLLVFYLGLQLTHHFFDKSLTKEVLGEYILMAILIGLILFKVAI